MFRVARFPQPMGDKGRFGCVLFLPVEIADRELDARILLGTAAVERGYAVVIGSKQDVAREAAKLGHGSVMLAKDVLIPGVDVHYKLMAERNVVILGQTEEAGIVYANFRDFFESNPSMKSIDAIDGYFAWGPEDFQFLRSQFRGLESANIFMSGSPRAALWGQLGKSFYEEDIALLGEKFGPYILFASSFPAGNYSVSEEEYRKFVKDRRQFPLFDLEARRRLAAENQAGIALFQESVELLLDRTDFNVVIRPHPDESPELWKKFFSGNRRVTVVDGGDVTPLILASVAVVHHSSTVALQAFGNVTRLISLADPKFSTGLASNIPWLLSEHAYSAEDLVRLLVSDDTRELEPSKRNLIESKLVGRGDSSSLTKILDVVDSKRSDTSIPFDLSGYGKWSAILKGILQYLASHLPAQYLRFDVRIALRKRPLMNRSFVMRRVHSAARSLGVAPYPIVKVYGRRLILLRPSRPAPE